MVSEDKKSIIKSCKFCLYTTQHPLGLVIDSNGICSGCKIHLEKNYLNWKSRFNKLKKIVKLYKSNFNNYDCIVPVNGGHDSYFIVHIVKNFLGLNPLLVNYNTYFNNEIGIRNLSNLRIKFDSDILIKNVNIQKVKKITKYTLTKFGNVYWHCIAGQTVFPVEISIKYKIPLIIWGAHQGIEQVGMYSYLNEVEMSRRYRKDHDLFGFEAEDLIKNENNLNYDDIQDFIYPSFKEINDQGTRGIYLNNYIRWDPKKQNEQMIKLYNYNSSKIIRSFDKYEYTHCAVYMGIHDILKMHKHGYSKVTDQAVREIRFRRMSKSKANYLVKYYSKQKINTNNFCDWLGVSQNSLDFIIKSFKTRPFFKKENNFSLKNNKNFIKKISNTYILNQDKKFKIKKFITFGKGHD